jgi:DNA ligase (NAD+)
VDFRHDPQTDFRDPDELSREEAAEQVKALREGIEHHDYLYYVKADPEISDATYDRLFSRLQELEEAFPELDSPNSPTKRVGAPPVDELPRVDHTATMLSLDAVLEREEVREFHRRVCEKVGRSDNMYTLEPKFDGLSVEVVYRDGGLDRGATRGDGRTGEDITRNLRTIGALPLRLREEADPPSLLAVRGEVIMPRDGFQELNRRRVEQGEDAFANPRNAAAGIVRQLDPSKVADKPLTVFFYEVLQQEGAGLESHWDTLRLFEEWGLKTSGLNRRASTLEDLEGFHSRLSEDRDDMDFEIDGVVIKLDDYGSREELGTRQRSPRWAVAWKFEPKKEVTRLRDIVVQVGRTGKLTPVALLDPVDVGGVTVSRATLHNAGEVDRKDVRPGDRVRVQRAGDVIPEVVERIKEPGRKRAEPFGMPDECPVCGSEVFREGAYHFCPGGLSCRAQLKGSLVHYASREAMDIDHLGEETAKDLVEREMVEDIADLYDLEAEQLEELEGFAERSAGQLHEAIQSARSPRLDRFLYALGIRHVGRHVAGVLAGELGDLGSVREASAERLSEIDEIGPEIADSIAGFFDDERNTEVLDRLLDAGVDPRPVKDGSGGPLEGVTVVFTGGLEGYTRSEARRRVEDRGGRATDSVSSATDYLVVGDDPGGKLDEAREEESVEILDEEGFEDLLEEGGG